MKRLSLWITLLVAGTFAALTGCSDGIQTVEEGRLQCVEPCEMRFPVGDIGRQYTAKFSIENTGLGPIEIFTISYENSAPSVLWANSTILNAFDRASWEPQQTASGSLLGGDGYESLILERGERFEIELTFGPASDGIIGCPGGDTSNCGVIVIESNDRDEEGRRIEVPIQLSVSEGSIEVSPTVINFPDPVVGNTFIETFNVSNSGQGDLLVTNLTKNSEDLLVASSSGLSLPISVSPGTMHEFQITWTPSTDEALDDTILIDSNDVRGTRPAIRVRSGEANAPILDVDPCDITISEAAVGEETRTAFDVTNSGSQQMTLSMTLVQIEPPDARAELDLRRADNDEPAQGQQDPIAPGNSRTYELVFNPTADRSVQGQISLSGNFDGTTRRCSFRAGPASPEIEVAPEQIYIGGVAMGDSVERSFVVANQGRADLDVSSIALAESGDTVAEYTIDGDAASGFTLAPGESRRVTVVYNRADPDVDARDEAQLRIEHNDPVVTSPLNVFVQANHGGTLLPPTCELTVTPPEPYSVGDTVTLDASGSSPADGTTFTPNPFEWSVVSPAGSTASLSADFGANVDLTFDVAGTYEVSMTATADLEGTSVDCEITRNLLVTE